LRKGRLIDQKRHEEQPKIGSLYKSYTFA
jgi:hypothetical protein